MSREERFLKPREVAELLRVHRVTVTEWIRAGRIKAIRVGRLWRIPESEVRRLLEQGVRGG